MTQADKLTAAFAAVELEVDNQPVTKSASASDQPITHTDKLAASLMVIELHEAETVKQAAGLAAKGIGLLGRVGGRMFGRGAGRVAAQGMSRGAAQTASRGMARYVPGAARGSTRATFGRLFPNAAPVNAGGGNMLSKLMPAKGWRRNMVIGSGLYAGGRAQQGAADKRKFNGAINDMSAQFGNQFANMGLGQRMQLALGTLFKPQMIGQGIADMGRAYNI